MLMEIYASDEEFKAGKTFDRFDPYCAEQKDQSDPRRQQCTRGGSSPTRLSIKVQPMTEDRLTHFLQ